MSKSKVTVWFRPGYTAAGRRELEESVLDDSDDLVIQNGVLGIGTDDNNFGIFYPLDTVLYWTVETLDEPEADVNLRK